MAMNVAVTVSAVDRLSGPLKGMGKSMMALETNLRSASAQGALFNARWAETIQLAQRAGAVMTGLGVAILAVAGKSVQAAMVQEEAQDRLNKIWGEGAAELGKFASEMQKQTQFGDELTLSTMAIGATYKNLKPVMEEATKTAMNMSVAYGMDLVQAMHLLGKASAGQVGMLSRYGIIVDKAKVKTEGMSAVYEAIANETKHAATQTDNASKSFDRPPRSTTSSSVTEPIPVGTDPERRSRSRS